MTAFEEMGVLPELGKAVEDMGWMLPTDVQSEAIPAILGGGDVLMAAETGSGKTGAFCLPVLQVVWETEKELQSGKPRKGGGASAVEAGWALNVWDRDDSLAIDPSGLLSQARDARAWHGARANKGVSGKGKYYYEAKVSDDGLCRVGFSTAFAKLNLGTDEGGFGFGGTGKKSNNSQFDDYGESFSLGDVIGAWLDLDNWEITFSKNGQIFGPAFHIPPKLQNQVFYPSVVLKNAEILFNFGDSAFAHSPSSEGFVGFSKAASEHMTMSSKGAAPAPAASGGKPKRNAPYCVILEPSRELAEQTFEQMAAFSKYVAAPKVRNVLAVGGVPARDQLAAMSAGVDVVTGTPGRLDEFVSSGELDLSNVRFFILDEADGLLSAGHGALINRIHALIPKVSPEGQRLQMVVCSATLHNFDVKKMAEKLMHFPQWVDLKGQDSVPETVHHVVAMVDPAADRRWIGAGKNRIATDGVHARDDIRPGSKDAATLSEAVKVLKGLYTVQAIDQHRMDKALIFCRTKLDCDNMERWLGSRGPTYSCVCLHGDRRPQERKENLQKFKDGKVKFLVCTDVAARGIDVKGVPYVINVTLPDDKANYLHRIGRVGRAERMGLAISLVAAVPEKVWYHGCPSRGKSCNNTRLTDEGGCAIWYQEPQLLAEVEDHLGVTIQQTDREINVQADEFDGKVTYGAKKLELGTGYAGHAGMLQGTVLELANLERATMTSYFSLKRKLL